MPRIAPLPRSQYRPYTHLVDLFVRKVVGESIAPLGVTARVPALVRSSTAMERVFMSRRRQVPHRLLELVSLRTAMEIGCAFCVDMGSFMAHEHHDVSGEELAALLDHAGSGRFGPEEVAALDLAVAMTATPPLVDDALVARLKAHWTDAQIVELTSMIGWENYRARTNATYGMGSQGLAAPGACAVPSPAAAAAHATSSV